MKTPIALFLVSLGVASIASGMTFTATSLADGYFVDVTGGQYDSFDSTAASISASYCFYGTSDSMQYVTGYLQFNVSALAGHQVDGVTLNVYLEGISITSPTPTAGSINYVVNSSGANGNAAQRLGGSTLVTTIVSQPTGWLSLDITSLVQATIDAGYSYACFSFDADTTGDYSNRNSGFSVTSADSATNKPYINVESVPEPATTAALIGLGILPLVYLRRRAK
jgi:hypothetical protein